jgi:predicted patatin/cPLA2 family phospholipase
VTGRAEYIEEYRNRERMMAACRASSSLPFAAPMVEVDGVPMLDGGIADSIPIRKAIADGFDHSIVILTRGKGYYKNEENSRIMNLVRLYYRKYPRLAQAILKRNHLYNREVDLVEHLEAQGKAFVIRPQIPCISRTERDLEKMEDFYWHGYELARELYPQLREWLSGREECISRKRLLASR